MGYHLPENISVLVLHP